MQISDSLGRALLVTMTLSMGVPAFSAPAPSTPLLISASGDVEVRSVQAQIMLPARGTVVLPEYPPAARRGRMDGRVRLAATIDRRGRVTDLACLDCRKDRAGFAASAMEAVERWIYKPAESPDGDPVAVSILFDIRFRPAPGSFVRPARRAPAGG